MKAVVVEEYRTLRSTTWDGLPPATGDVLLMGDDVCVVERVAEGPGVGQYRLVVRVARVIRWHDG